MAMKHAAMAAALVLTAGAAQAATLDVIGGAAATLPSAFSGWQPSYYDLDGGVGRVGDAIKVFTADAKTADNGLFLKTPSTLTFTFLLSEAGFDNVLDFDGTEVFDNKTAARGDVSASFALGAGFVPFTFISQGFFAVANDGEANSAVRLAFSETFNGGASILAFFDDRTTDIDYDDLVVRIDVTPTVTPIPTPASGLVLLSALAGVIALRRRRAA